MYNKRQDIWSDMANSYAWDTAIVFIQKYSGNSNYINTGRISGFLNTGKLGDKACNIHDMLSNSYEWSTEYSTHVLNSGKRWPCVYRGGDNESTITKSLRLPSAPTNGAILPSFRPILYFN